jgi:hypothetical protein
MIGRLIGKRLAKKAVKKASKRVGKQVGKKVGKKAMSAAQKGALAKAVKASALARRKIGSKVSKVKKKIGNSLVKGPVKKNYGMSKAQNRTMAQLKTANKVAATAAIASVAVAGSAVGAKAGIAKVKQVRRDRNIDTSISMIERFNKKGWGGLTKAEQDGMLSLHGSKQKAIAKQKQQLKLDQEFMRRLNPLLGGKQPTSRTPGRFNPTGPNEKRVLRTMKFVV